MPNFMSFHHSGTVYCFNDSQFASYFSLCGFSEHADVRKIKERSNDKCFIKKIELCLNEAIYYCSAH